MKYKFADTFEEMMNLPKDICSNEPIIRMYGNKYFYIENYQSILEYTDQKLVVLGFHNKICIMGKNFKLSYLARQELILRGMMEQVLFKTK